MNQATAKQILDKIVGQVFGYKNPLSLEQFMQKYAFDIRLPQKVNDSTTGEETWTQSVNPSKFISIKNAWDREDWSNKPGEKVTSIQQILAAWNEINFTATDRHLDSENVAESDNVYSSTNIYRSVDVRRSKNVLFSDGATDCEYVVASQRSNTSNYCIRLDDSVDCSNSFSVVWSKKIVNSFFIEDCGDLYECMFCSHITNKKFCIANMQFEEAEYLKLKEQVVRWILTN